ncbi:hypothetical protein [Brevundimonas sp. R86498]|uniref:hypothetical protein n=1 Tax=Brevundimonas sp. R86498 TaxID=3093845 RepID=UPI0037CA6F31
MNINNGFIRYIQRNFTTMTMTNTKRTAHREWLNDLRSRPREEAAKLIADRFPKWSEAEIQRGLKYLESPPPSARKIANPPLTKRVKTERAKLSKAIARARNLPARYQDELSRKLLAKAEGGQLDDL